MELNLAFCGYELLKVVHSPSEQLARGWIWKGYEVPLFDVFIGYKTNLSSFWELFREVFMPIFSCCVTNFSDIYQDFSTTWRVFKATSRILKKKHPRNFAGSRGPKLKICQRRRIRWHKQIVNDRQCCKQIRTAESFFSGDFFCLQLVEKQNIYHSGFCKNENIFILKFYTVFSWN